LEIVAKPPLPHKIYPRLFVDDRPFPPYSEGIKEGRDLGGLTVIGVKNAKPGRHADGAGLYLLVKPSGSRSWLLRVQVDGRRRDIGLGGLSDLTLSEAREKAAILRKVARTGKDPIFERDRDRRGVPNFREAALSCHSELKAGWTLKSGAAFISSLKDHAFSRMGSIRVDQVEASHIRDTLAPIWLAKPEQARKVRQRVGMVLNFAKSKGWRSAEVPGKSVTLGLAKQGAGGNFAAMPYQEVPAFISSIAANRPTVGRLALLFTIFTAARSGEVRSAQWAHLDLNSKLWNRPAQSMKSNVAHAVTLSDQAINVAEAIREIRITNESNSFVFPSARATSLSDMTLSKIMRDAGLKYTVHGFRSSFRDWAAEQMPNVPDAVAESALAHVVSDKVVRAYKRTQFVEMRHKLLQAWADYVSPPTGECHDLPVGPKGRSHEISRDALRVEGSS
jgi:integrase